MPTDPLPAALAGLIQQWYAEQATYPPTSEGLHAAAAVRCCAKELAALVESLAEIGRRPPPPERTEELLNFIAREGYRRCDIPACNCNSFHGGHAMARLTEIGAALLEAGVELQGRTILSAVKELAGRSSPPEGEPT